MKNIITVSREYGTGGQDIGIRLAEELGFRFYNKELITKLAENLMIPEVMIKQADTVHEKKNIFHEVFRFWTNAETENARYIFEEQGKFIRKLADEGNCVFAGRRADYYLKDYPNAMHLFFYAPLEYRIHHVMETENLSSSEAARKIDSMDKMRKNSYEYTTGRKWGERHNYHRMIDMSAFSEEQVIQELALLVRGSV